MRNASSSVDTKILPSPILSSGTMTSTFSLGRKSTVYSEPRYSSVWPFWRPKPRTSVTVIPITPIAGSASFTSSSLKGLMIASTFFISDLLEDRDRQRRYVRADPFQVGQDIEVDLRRLDRFGQPGAQATQVRLAQVPLPLPHERALVEHVLGERAVVGRERGDHPFQVL